MDDTVTTYADHPLPKTCMRCKHSIGGGHMPYSEAQLVCTQVVHLITGAPADCVIARMLDPVCMLDLNGELVGELPVEYVNIRGATPVEQRVACGRPGRWWEPTADARAEANRKSSRT